MGEHEPDICLGGWGVKIFLNKIQLELPWVPKINSSLPEFAMQKISPLFIHSSFRAKR